MLSVKQGGMKNHFWVFDMTRPGIEHRSYRLLENTLFIWPIDLFEYVWIHIHNIFWEIKFIFFVLKQPTV